MSQENVELQHRVIDDFNRRDLDAYLALVDPDVKFTPYEVSVQGGDPYRGHDGVRKWSRLLRGPHGPHGRGVRGA